MSEYSVKILKDKNNVSFLPFTTSKAVYIADEDTTATVQDALEDLDLGKQAKLISGSNIKTINGQSVLGSGDIEITTGAVAYSDLTGKPKINNVELNGNKTTSDLGLFSGSYNDLTNKPTIPTKISDLTNDSSFLEATDVIDDVVSTDTDKPLSANMGKELQDQITNLKSRGRYLSIWDCTTGLAKTTPTTDPYTYRAGDYFIVGTVGTVNYRPTGSSYSESTPSTTVETQSVKVTDTYYYDGTSWTLLDIGQIATTFASLGGSPYDNSNLATALNSKVTNTSYPSSTTGGVIKVSSIYGTTASDGILQASTRTYAEYTAGSDNCFIGKGTLENVFTGKGFATESYVNTAVAAKQDTLVSGTNIKTINNQSLLGSGNIVIQSGGGGVTDYDELENRPQINSVVLTGNKSSDALGLQSKITATTKVSSDFIDDTNKTNKFVTAAEKTTWSGKQDAISDLTAIRNGAAAGTSALQPYDNISQLTNNVGYTTKVTGTITGDGSEDTFVISHTLNTRAVSVTVYSDTDYEEVIVDVTHTSNSAITITFKDAPASGTTYTVVIIG